MPSRLKNSRGVYLITPDDNDSAHLFACVERLLQQPLALLQYRHKTGSAAMRYTQAEGLLGLCRAAGVPMLINDDWMLAKAIGADGVHLGALDDDPATVRKALGDDALIGVSCYNDFERARQLAAFDVDYLAFGAVFASKTKPLAKQAPLALFQQAKALAKTTVAIGGITPDNSALLRAAGADLIAVLSGVFDASDPAAALAAYNHTFFKVEP
jgi:thiamine-phosphate pyrophosphorylase